MDSLLALAEKLTPHFDSGHDAAAFAVHEAFVSAGWAIRGADGQSLQDRLPDTWQAGERGTYEWTYVREGASDLLVTLVPMRNLLLVNVLQEEPRVLVQVTLPVALHVVEGVPLGAFRELYNRAESIADKVRHELDVVLRVEAPAAAAGPPAGPPQSTLRDGPVQRAVPPPAADPLADPAWVQRRAPPVGAPPFAVGSEDLLPSGLAPVPGSHNPFGAGALGGPGGDRMGPHHPGFGPGRPGAPRRPAGVPPGARFDPFGPGGRVGMDPDNDAFAPPGGPPSHMYW